MQPRQFTLTLTFLCLSLLLSLCCLGSDTSYDEPNYCGIARTLWESGKPSITAESPKAFKDSPPLVPAILSPVVGMTESIRAARIAHWFLFVLPGLLGVSIALRPLGTLPMTVGFLVLFLFPFHLSEAMAHVNLDEGLSSWGLVALLCFVRGRHLTLGLVAIALATLCKYQAIVLCGTLFVFTLWHRPAWKRLMLYGAVSASAMIAWLAFLRLHNGDTGTAAGADRFVWNHFDMRFLLRACIGYWPAFLLPTVMIAAVGILRNRRESLIIALSLFLLFTLGFNVATIGMPGGMGYYLTPALPALAICAAYAFAGREIALFPAVCLLMLGAAKNFIPVPLPAAGYIGILLVVAGCLAIHLPIGRMLALVSLFVVILPCAQNFCPLATPDAELRSTLEDCRHKGYVIGTWEDPRLDWYGRRGTVQAKWKDRWETPDVYLMAGFRNELQDREYPDRWREFQAFLRENYRRESETGATAVFVRRIDYAAIFNLSSRKERRAERRR